MVDVTLKPPVFRRAVAAGTIRMKPATLGLILRQKIAKGDVFAAARLAGIMGAKKASEIIPLCHPLPITAIGVELSADRGKGTVGIAAEVKTEAKTGVEMEALAAVAAAALTVYDMVKAVDRTMVIGGIRVVEKSKGDSTGNPAKRMFFGHPSRGRQGKRSVEAGFL